MALQVKGVFVSFLLLIILMEEAKPLLAELQGENRSQLDERDLTITDTIIKINEVADIEPELFEGDMDLSSEPNQSDDPPQKRNAQRLRQYIWKSKIVPYEVSDQLVQDGYLPNIEAAIKQFTEHTCVQWKSRDSNDKQWVTFVKRSGCYSHVGVRYWTTGSQEISLGRGCNHQGIIMHEMMHAIGFRHEQSRYDRNQYVEVLWENIEPGKEDNFKKYNLHQIDYLNEVYDMDSIMHYGKNGFSKNGKPTIQAIGDPNKHFGQRDGFSKTDIAQINALYDCSAPSGGWSSWTAYGPCDSQCKHKRQRFCASHDLNNCPGADRFGIETRTEDCSQEKCYAPVDGHWGKWTAWPSCSVSCDTGTHIRTRQCGDPAPKNGGKYCVGDDKQVGNCVMRSCNPGPYDCDFEASGICHWTICPSNLYPKWYRHTGPTPTFGTGPQNDHTSGSGNYLYLEASWARPGQTACFFSQEFPAGSCQTLTFWYHMLGSGIGKLTVQTKSSKGTASVWEKSGEQGDKWLQASVKIKSNSPYKVYFEGRRGVDWQGDIAVDDISFKDCAIALPPSTVPPSTLPPSTQPPTTSPPTQPTVPDSCDFDGGSLCDWTNSPNNPEQDGKRYDWQLHKGVTPSSKTGPSGDHSADGQGGYIYLDSSTSHRYGSKAMLISKELSGGSAMCLHFWYHMYGSRGMGKFRVLVQKRNRRWGLFMKAGNRGDKWLYRKITLNRFLSKSPFKIVFEGERGRTGLSDIALDDVKIVSGVCT